MCGIPYCTFLFVMFGIVATPGIPFYIFLLDTGSSFYYCFFLFQENVNSDQISFWNPSCFGIFSGKTEDLKIPRVPQRNSRVGSTHLARISAELLFPPHISNWVRDSNKTINSDLRSPPVAFFLTQKHRRKNVTLKTQWGIQSSV